MVFGLVGVSGVGVHTLVLVAGVGMHMGGGGYSTERVRNFG